MKNVVYLVIISLILFTCTKPGKNITVKGRVFNPITGKGYEGAEIILLRSEFFKLPGGLKEIKSTTSNANGEFEISKLSVFHVDVKVYNLNASAYRIGWYENGVIKTQIISNYVAVRYTYNSDSSKSQCIKS